MQILKRVSTGWFITLLWLASVLIAVVQIVVLSDLLMRLYVFVLQASGAIFDPYGTEFWAGLTLRNFIVFGLAVLVLIFAVWTGEYHARHVGSSSSWKIFGWTFGVQTFIFVVAYFL